MFWLSLMPDKMRNNSFMSTINPMTHLNQNAWFKENIGNKVEEAASSIWKKPSRPNIANRQQ